MQSFHFPSIYDAIRNIYDILQFTKDEDIPGLMVALDFEKAFDSLSIKFLLMTLKKFDFGPSFIPWIQTLYKNACRCIRNNGFASNFFSINRGVRQGDPLSAYLFIIALEVLSIRIHNTPEISGIVVKSEEEYEELCPNFDFKWDEIYNRPFKTTIDCKTREFQYILRSSIVFYTQTIY